MPKASGESQKMTRLPGKAPAPSRKIMTFDPKPGAKTQPNAQGAPKWADQLTASPVAPSDGDDKVDPRQQHY